MPYCFARSSSKFQGHTGQNITDFDPNWAFPDYRLVAAFKSLRFALFGVIHQISRSHGLKNRRFKSNLSKITRLVAAIKSLRFALLSCFLFCYSFFPVTFLPVTFFPPHCYFLVGGFGRTDVHGDCKTVYPLKTLPVE